MGTVGPPCVTWVLAVGTVRVAEAREAPDEGVEAGVPPLVVDVVLLVGHRREDRAEVAETWSRERAERLIQDYNNLIKSSLGIPWEYEPQVVQAAPAVTEPEFVPEPRWDKVEIQPNLAPGYLGVTVKF